MPVVGKRMLIVCGYGWVVVADVKEQTGPFQFRLENTSLLCRTGGVPWDELADGERRSEMVTRKWGEVWVGPTFGPCREWKGELP